MCPEETDTYADFGHYPGVHLNMPSQPKGRYKLLKTINEGIQVSNNEWQQEKDIEQARKQAEMDRENEIPHKEEENSGNSLHKKFLIALLTLLPLTLAL